MLSLSLPAICLLIFYSLVVLLPLAASTEDTFRPQDFHIGHVFALSADAPLTKQLSKFQPFVDAANLILTHFERVENSIIASINTGKAPAPDDDIRPCNHNEPTFARSAASKAGVRGWPTPDGSCVSDVFGTDLNIHYLSQHTTPPYTVDDLYQAMLTRGNVIKDNIRSIITNVIDNFTNPDFVYNCPYQTPSQRCVLHLAAGFRIGTKWYLANSITNQPKSAQLPLFGRQTVTEVSRLDHGRFNDTKLMCLPRRPKQGEEHIIWNNATTVITSFAGIGRPSIITRIYIDENPAILRSLDKSDLFVQQAEDALTASNIAILVLPLGLNLVPIALLADVSTVTMLAYTLLSDVLTVVPLGIKGAELISIGSQRHRSVTVRMTGASNGSRAESVTAEVFAAECLAHDNVLPTGLAFLVLSIAFLVGGITAEFLARFYARKRKERRLQELKEAGLVLSSKGSSTPGNASQGAPPLPSLASLDVQSQRAEGSTHRSGSFKHYCKQVKREKNA